MFVITISRQTGSLGDDIATSLAKKLGLELITHEFVLANWLPEVANDYELKMLEESPKNFLKHSEEAGKTYQQFIEDKLKQYAIGNSIIIKGLGSQFMFRGIEEVLHVRIVASKKARVNRIVHKYNMDEAAATQFLELSDRKHRRFISTLYGEDWGEQSFYDICINTDKLGSNEAVELIESASNIRKKFIDDKIILHGANNVLQDAKAILQDAKNIILQEESKIQQEKYVFKHPSEEEFSKILDMYNIKWVYEPRTFPVQWDTEGNVTMAFTPDFYLPRFNTYIELTTMNQKYVTEKNKKVRRLKELYPGININIVFKSDYHTLLKRLAVSKLGGIRIKE
jgi:cytidylate kinase